MNFENEASQYLTHVLGKFSAGELSEAESRAAFRLLCRLPDSACIKDFMRAAEKEQVDRAGLPSSVAEELAPLVIRLESNLPYAGRFASLFESGSVVAERQVSHL